MSNETERENWAFYLKRKGAFEEALKAYAKEYALSRERPFIAELCLEEMFDIVLLKLLRDRRAFESRLELLDGIRSEIIKVLQSLEAYDGEVFEKQFKQCQKKLFPRGRAKTPFSVDRRLLLAKEREALLRA